MLNARKASRTARGLDHGNENFIEIKMYRVIGVTICTVIMYMNLSKVEEILHTCDTRSTF